MQRGGEAHPEQYPRVSVHVFNLIQEKDIKHNIDSSGGGGRTSSYVQGGLVVERHCRVVNRGREKDQWLWLLRKPLHRYV